MPYAAGREEREREFEVGGTIVWFNYPLTCCWKLWIPRARTVRIFHCHLLQLLSTTSSTSIVKGCSLVFRGPEERGSLSREEIVFPSRGRKFSCRARRVSCANEAQRGKEATASSDASPDALGFTSWINLRLIIKTTEFMRLARRQLAGKIIFLISPDPFFSCAHCRTLFITYHYFVYIPENESNSSSCHERITFYYCIRYIYNLIFYSTNKNEKRADFREDSK